MTIWAFFGFLAVLCLAISFWQKRTAIWSGFIAGVFFAVIVAAVQQHDAINSATSQKIIVIGILAGAVYQLRGYVATRKS